MRRVLERSEIDLALFRRVADETIGIAASPEHLQSVTSRSRPIDFRRDPLPLARALARRNRLPADVALGYVWVIARGIGAVAPNL